MVEKNQQHIEKESSSSIILSTPWGGGNIVTGTWNTPQSLNDQNTNKSLVEHDHFITERTRLHEAYIREQEKSKRMGLVLAFLLILSSVLILLFAPDGREVLSYWLGAALIIFAAGAAGFGRVWGKAASISFGADQDKRGLDN